MPQSQNYPLYPRNAYILGVFSSLLIVQWDASQPILVFDSNELVTKYSADTDFVDVVNFESEQLLEGEL